MHFSIDVDRNELALQRQMQQTQAELDAKKLAQEKQEVAALQASLAAEKNTVEETKRATAKEYVTCIYSFIVGAITDHLVILR